MKAFLQRYLGPEALVASIFLCVLFLGIQIQNFRFQESPRYDVQRITIAGQELHAWIADTPLKRRLGLSVRDHLDLNEAMLFVFESEGQYAFWMKDMTFPIDIFWINEQQEIVHIHPYADPVDYPNSYLPESEARYVLETVAGFAERHSLREGDHLSF